MREGFIAKRAMHCVGVVPKPMLPAPMHVKGESSGGGMMWWGKNTNRIN